MSLFVFRPAFFLLTSFFAWPQGAHAVPKPKATPNFQSEAEAQSLDENGYESESGDNIIFGPDSNGICYAGSSLGPIVPCPTEVYPHLPKAAIAGIVVAIAFVIAFLIALLLWRRQVRNVNDDSASSLFDFVPETRNQSRLHLRVVGLAVHSRSKWLGSRRRSNSSPLPPSSPPPPPPEFPSTPSVRTVMVVGSENEKDMEMGEESESYSYLSHGSEINLKKPRMLAEERSVESLA